MCHCSCTHLVDYKYLHSYTLDHTQLYKICKKKETSYSLCKLRTEKNNTYNNIIQVLSWVIRTHPFDSGHPHILCHCNYMCLVNYKHLHSDNLEHTKLKKMCIELMFCEYLLTYVSHTGHPHILCHCSYMYLVHYKHLHSDTLGHIWLKSIRNHNKAKDYGCYKFWNTPVSHWSPSYPVPVQLHVFCELQTPPFSHIGLHTTS